MNEDLSWLESIIIRRNLRDSEEEQQHTSDIGGDSPYTASLQDYWSARDTLISEAGERSPLFTFNPFDSPYSSTEDLLALSSDLPVPAPLLPHSRSNSPLSPEVLSQQQQLIDILSENIDPTLYTEPLFPREAVFEDLALLQQGMSGWTEQSQTSILDQPNPKRWIEPTDPPAGSSSLPPQTSQDAPVCRGYLSGTCRNGASCIYTHKLPTDHEVSSRHTRHSRRGSHSDSDNGTMSSSSGTPSDAYRSPAPSRAPMNTGDNGWNNSSSSYNSNNNAYSHQSAGPSSGSSSHQPIGKPQQEYGWTAPPTQSNNNYQSNYNGRPVSPDGWPTKKQEIRGHEEAVPDLLSKYLNQTIGTSTAAHSSGWKKTSSHVSGDTVTAAKEIPLPASEVGNTGWTRPPRPTTPSPPPLSVPAAPREAVQEQRAPNTESSQPGTFVPIAPIPVAPAAVQSPSTSQVYQQHPHQPASQANAPANGTARPQSGHGTRIVGGWTVKVPFKHDDEASAVPPVPSLPQEHVRPRPAEVRKQTPPPIQRLPQPVTEEAWVLPDADAIKNNNWTSTTRRSRVSKAEQTPAYTPAYSYGHQEEASSINAPPSGYDDNSIRPSESASNVGIADDSMISPPGSLSRGNGAGAAAQPTQNAPRYKTMRKFESEKDSDIGSDGSSGSLNDNPNIRAGGWQRPAPVQPQQESKMARQASTESNARVQPRTSAGHPGQYQHPQDAQQSNNWSAPQAQTSGWIQGSQTSENRQAPLPAPTPKRWDSASQQLVGELERAATPRAPYSAHPAGTGHGRSVSTATRGPGSTMSIRGASKYHAESVMLREELDKIRAQVAKYENVLASMDAPEASSDAELEKELDYLRSENSYLRNKVEKLEAEKEQMKNALQPVWRMLTLTANGKQQNGGDHAGRMQNGN